MTAIIARPRHRLRFGGDEVVHRLVGHRAADVGEAEAADDRGQLLERVELVDLRADRVEPRQGVALPLDALDGVGLLGEGQAPHRFADRGDLVVVDVIEQVGAARLGVDHDEQPPARLYVTRDVVQRSARIGGDVHDPIAPYQVVVGRIGKRFEDVALFDRDVRELGACGAGIGDPAIGHVKGGDRGTEGCKGPGVAPGPATAIEHTLALEP
jgi:hypothetical protein